MPKYAFSIYGVDRPIGITTSPSGDRIYVAETAGDRALLVFDGKGTQIAQAVPPKSTPGTRTPVYVAVDPLTGDVYVSDRTAAAVYVYDKDGQFRRAFQPKVALPTWAPLGLAFDAQGNFYVGDVSEPHRILVFGRDGSLLRSLGKPGELSFPNGLAVDAKGNLFIADGNHGRLVVMDPNGTTIAVIPRGVGSGELGLPRGTALDDTGRLFVADTTGQAIQIYRLDATTDHPKYIGTAGSEGRGDGQFEYPFGVATDARARIYVADWANDRVQVWTY
jgi:DNA-binding beta-propeller fold protein YncE